MTQLPRFDPVEVATRADLALLRSDFDDLRTEFSDLKADFSDLRGELSELGSDVKDETSHLRKEMSSRLDRLHTTLVAGLFVIVAAMAGVFFTTL